MFANPNAVLQKWNAERISRNAVWGMPERRFILWNQCQGLGNGKIDLLYCQFNNGFWADSANGDSIQEVK